MELLDSSMLGATALFLNQYFNCIIPEYIVLWIALVSFIIELVKKKEKKIYCFNLFIIYEII